MLGVAVVPSACHIIAIIDTVLELKIPRPRSTEAPYWMLSGLLVHFLSKARYLGSSHSSHGTLASYIVW